MTDVQGVSVPPGSAPQEAKERVARLFSVVLQEQDQGFALPIAKRIEITEVSAEEKKGVPGRMETTVVCELDVQQGNAVAASRTSAEPEGRADMINGLGSLHGGASAYLINVYVVSSVSLVHMHEGLIVTAPSCSSLALAAVGKMNHVSQVLNVVYHAPVPP